MVIKALAYGAAIPVVAGFCGLRARGSSEGVGWATTAAVIGSSFAVIVLDFVDLGGGAVRDRRRPLMTAYIEFKGVQEGVRPASRCCAA